jgi:hypothetical protein
VLLGDLGFSTLPICGVLNEDSSLWDMISNVGYVLYSLHVCVWAR